MTTYVKRRYGPEMWDEVMGRLLPAGASTGGPHAAVAGDPTVLTKGVRALRRWWFSRGFDPSSRKSRMELPLGDRQRKRHLRAHSQVPFAWKW